MKRKICIINPNTTKAMTQKIDLTAKKFASVDTKIVSVEPKVGPESIEGFYDEAFCIPGLVEEIEKHSCLLYTSPSPRDRYGSRMPSSA